MTLSRCSRTRESSSTLLVARHADRLDLDASSMYWKEFLFLVQSRFWFLYLIWSCIFAIHASSHNTHMFIDISHSHSLFALGISSGCTSHCFTARRSSSPRPHQRPTARQPQEGTRANPLVDAWPARCPQTQGHWRASSRRRKRNQKCCASMPSGRAQTASWTGGLRHRSKKLQDCHYAMAHCHEHC
jgi:hypothetical protein